MKSIYKKEIDKKVKEIVYIDGADEISIVFEDNSVFKISDYHMEDCCEHVYADFSNIKPYLPQLETTKEIKFIEIIPVKDIGFILSIQEDVYNVLKKVLIPCYNSQNGYYGTDLELNIEYEGVKSTVDISDLVEDNIN